MLSYAISGPAFAYGVPGTVLRTRCALSGTNICHTTLPGGFGRVYAGVERRSQQQVAMKNLGGGERARRELRFTLKLSHPNVVAYRGHFQVRPPCPCAYGTRAPTRVFTSGGAVQKRGLVVLLRGMAVLKRGTVVLLRDMVLVRRDRVVLKGVWLYHRGLEWD